MIIQKDEFIYAVARIRCKEGKLFSSKNIEQIISMNDADSIIRYLLENGWNSPKEGSGSDILKAEESALWELMKELTGDLSVFDFIRLPVDFQNLKAVIKAVYTECDPQYMYTSGGITDPKLIYKAVLDKEYSDLPCHLIDVAQEAVSVLYKTADGQLCDSIIDKACLSAVYEEGMKNSDLLIKKYCELFVASGNIKVAVRGVNLRKSLDFILRSMAECDSLNIKNLSIAATKSFDDICTYLSSTDYKAAVPFIKESVSAFEKWCDNYIMEAMKTQKSEPFSIGPLIAYIIAKQTEIKAVRLILTAKTNELDEAVIRERIRNLYV